MDTLEQFRNRLSRLYRLIQKARNDRRRSRLKAFYEQYYETYRKQKMIIEDIDRFQFR